VRLVANCYIPIRIRKIDKMHLICTSASVFRQLLAVPCYWLSIYGRHSFLAAGPQSETLSWISSGTRPSVQTVQAFA